MVLSLLTRSGSLQLVDSGSIASQRRSGRLRNCPVFTRVSRGSPFRRSMVLPPTEGAAAASLARAVLAEQLLREARAVGGVDPAHDTGALLGLAASAGENRLAVRQLTDGDRLDVSLVIGLEGAVDLLVVLTVVTDQH